MTESSNLEHQSPHGELRTAFYNPYDIKRRRRTSRSQFKTLEKAFIENPKPNASTRQQLAQRLSMTPRGIQVWFQNRRAKNKQANTAVHQANPNLSTDDTQVEDDIGPEGDPLLAPDESGPIERDSASYAPTRTFESSNTLGEPPKTNKAQATRSDSMTSDFSSSVLSIESLAVKADTTRLQGNSDAQNLSTNFQSCPAPFSSPSLSALGPAARQFIYQPRFVDTPVVTRDAWRPGTLHKSQDSPRRRNSKTINFQGLPPAVSTIPIVHRRPSTLSLLRRMSMPATIRVSSDQEGNIWSDQHPSPSTEDLQQSIPHQRPHPFSVNNTNTINNNAQPPPFHPSLPPQPPLSRKTPSIDASTVTAMATTAAITAAMGGTQLSSTVFGHVGLAGVARGHARTYPLSRRVSIHETSLSSSHHGSRHKAVHSLDGLSSSSTLDGISQTEPIVSPIEIQNKRRKSVSKHFRPSGGSPMTGIHVFDTSGGIVHGDTPSFSGSPTSVNAPSFTFSPPEQQPRIADNQVFGRTTSATNPHTLIENQGKQDSGPRVVWMGGIGVTQQLPLKRDTTNAADPFTATDNSGDFGASAASPTQQKPSLTVSSVGGLSSTQQSYIMAGQGTTLAQSTMVTTGEASHFGSLDPRKCRRRSSLKTTPRNKGQPGVRVQFDIQHSPTGPNISASSSQDSFASPMQQANYAAAENVYQDSWINMTMHQRPPTDDSSMAKLSDDSSMVLLDREVQKQSSSHRPPDAPGRSGNTTALPTSSLPLSVASGSSSQGEVIYWPTATGLSQVGYSSPDSPALDSTVLQDAQQARRNSCPPGFIECFNKGLQIIPDPSSLSSQTLVNQSGIAVFHHQQEIEHRLQLQQQQHQFQQQQLQLQLQYQHQQQLQQQLQHQQYQQQFFFPVQELQASTTGSSTSSTPKTDVDPFTWQEQPLGIVFPEGHVAERREQSFRSTMPTDSLSALDHETNGSDLDVQELRRAHLSASGHRHSLADPHHLPQLQTPRLLAQQQHQVEQPPWSRTWAAYSIQPARSRLSLPVTLQDTFGRRFSEPANISKDISGSLTQQGTVPLLDGDDLSPPSQNTTLYQWQSDQDGTLETAFTFDPNMPPKIEETPLSTSLHPLDASTSDASDIDQSPSAYASSSHMTATPALGQHMPVDSFPTPMTASPASSISSSPSPSSSPVIRRDTREFPIGKDASSSPMSIGRPATYSGPSPPVWGTPSSVAMAVTLSPSIEAPLLMRAHSLDSLMLQPSTIRESPSMLVNPNALLASPRRHSQGPSSSVSTEQGPQTHSSPCPQFVRQDLLQTQPPYFPSPGFPPPLSPLSPITFNNSPDVHPLDQHGQQHQQHQQQQRQQQQQQQHSLQLGQPWNAALPTTSQLSQPVSPHVVQRQQSDMLNQGSPTIVMPHEGFGQNINWDQSLPAMNHFAILQQKLPLAHQQQQEQQQQQQQQQESQQSHHSQSQSKQQQIRLQELQQQQQQQQLQLQLHQQHQQNQLQQEEQQQPQQQISQPLPQGQAQPLQQHKHQQPLQPLQEHPPLTLPPPPLLAPESISGSPVQSFAPEPTSTVPCFKDAKAFEEYKHQQFILEHQRLQQRQELEIRNDQMEAKLDQERVESHSSVGAVQSDPRQQPSRSSEFGDKSTSTSRLSGHFAIATALVPSSVPPLSPSALKKF